MPLFARQRFQERASFPEDERAAGFLMEEAPAIRQALRAFTC